MLTIDIGKTDKLPGISSLYVKMSEYDRSVVTKIKALTTRVYHPDNKVWELPVTMLSWVIDNFGHNKIVINFTNTQDKETHKRIPKSVQYKTELFSYQKEGVEFGINHDKFLLADEMGLGKTLQSLVIALCHKANKKTKQCLIVCGVNSTKYNWLNEVKKHTYEEGFILGTRKRLNGNEYISGMPEKIEDLKTRKEFFLITNIETFRNKNFLDAFNKNKSIDCIILDEAHHITTPETQQTRNLLKSKNCKCKIAMTGTPVLNKPLDVYTSLKWLGVENSSYNTFKNYYCNFTGPFKNILSGYKNLDILRNQLSTHMLRRRTEDVLDLPELMEIDEYVEMDSAQRAVYNEIRTGLLQQVDLILNSPNPLVYLLRLRQATGDTSIVSSQIAVSCKLDRLQQLVQDIVDNNKKCLIFSNWTSMTDKIVRRLFKHKPLLITGEVKDIDRQRNVDIFQTNDLYKVCVGTIGAMGTGLTLTEATTCIFMDLPWTYAIYEQAYRRCYRIGSTNKVNVIRLICQNTIDETIFNIIYKKKQYSDMLVDGKFTVTTRNQLLNLIGQD